MASPIKSKEFAIEIVNISEIPPRSISNNQARAWTHFAMKKVFIISSFE